MAFMIEIASNNEKKKHVWEIKKFEINLSEINGVDDDEPWIIKSRWVNGSFEFVISNKSRWRLHTEWQQTFTWESKSVQKQYNMLNESVNHVFPRHFCDKFYRFISANGFNGSKRNDFDLKIQQIKSINQLLWTSFISDTA